MLVPAAVLDLLNAKSIMPNLIFCLGHVHPVLNAVLSGGCRFGSPAVHEYFFQCTQELKALTDVLEATPFAFALELAALAARREYLNLEKWLQERMAVHGVPFIQVSIGQ